MVSKQPCVATRGWNLGERVRPHTSDKYSFRAFAGIRANQRPPEDVF